MMTRTKKYGSEYENVRKTKLFKTEIVEVLLALVNKCKENFNFQIKCIKFFNKTSMNVQNSLHNLNFIFFLFILSLQIFYFIYWHRAPVFTRRPCMYVYKQTLSAINDMKIFSKEK